MSGSDAAEFDAVGAAHFKGVLKPDDIDRVASLFGPGHRPGKRLGFDELRPVRGLIESAGVAGRIAAQLIGKVARPVRALLLDKSAAANWRLGWHQDRTIAVREKIETSGFGPWSIKAGQIHVQPPHEITSRMVTLRVHVDPVDTDNGPLEILAGSHLLGQLPNDEVDRLAATAAKLVCLAEPGDVWAYSTAIVHASAEQRREGRRRVLQIDYSADALPGGLNWTVLI